ncbi:MAG: pre-peptidase C-terminal domain-containing protein [Anaerolineae bacterium]|jgi:hypothetical protein
MKKRMRISRPALIAVAAVAATLGLLLLMASIADVRTRAAPLDDQGTGSDPRIETCTVTADFPISDTHPGDGVAKTVYFTNKSGGVITATLGVSGTPTLVFVAPAVFDAPMDVQMSSLAQASFVVTYVVAATHTTQLDVAYTAVNTDSVETVIEIDYVQDITAPEVTVTAPSATSATSFTISWEASDPAPGSGVVASYTVAYREDDGVWEPWLSSTALTESTFLSATINSTYAFSVTVYDHVSNRGEGVAVTQVGQQQDVYLPLVMSDWVWWYQFDIYEPNDSLSEAYGPLTSTQVYTAYIWDTTDAGDYYHFTPSTTDQVQVTLTNIPVGADYDLYIYDSVQGTWLAWSDNPGNQNESVPFTPVAGRKYYILVSPYGGTSNNSQPYYLTVTYN